MNTRNFTICLLVWCMASTSCSSKALPTDSCKHYYDSTIKKVIYTDVDKMPEFPEEGQLGVSKYLVKNFRYPKQDYFQGSFVVEFIVNENGAITDAKIKSKDNQSLTPAEKELIKVVTTMPKWIPGECSGKKVPVRMYIPLKM